MCSYELQIQGKYVYDFCLNLSMSLIVGSEFMRRPGGEPVIGLRERSRFRSPAVRRQQSDAVVRKHFDHGKIETDEFPPGRHPARR